jgi:plastocyanin
MNAKTALIAVALSLGISPAMAGNHDVHLTSGTAFSPNSIADVLVGDTITFINDAGGFHNAVSTDAAFPFRCAVDCGANGGGSNANWTAVVTVPATAAHKDIPFFCEIHGAALMSGVIHITNPVDVQSFEID